MFGSPWWFLFGYILEAKLENNWCDSDGKERFKYILDRCLPNLLWTDFFSTCYSVEILVRITFSQSFISAFKKTKSINKQLFLLSLHQLDSLSYAFIFFINMNGKLFLFIL